MLSAAVGEVVKEEGGSIAFTLQRFVTTENYLSIVFK
jgi:hypothetical protein